MALAQGSCFPPGGDEKRSYVKEMFTAIAPRYDLLNHLLSFNIDRLWRRRAVSRLQWEDSPGGVYLDLCAGTLDLAAELARRRQFSGRVVAVDFVVRMLKLGRGKANRIRPVGGDALTLPFGDAQFEGCMVGFGVRNLANVATGLAEIARVLKPGARAVILEFSTPGGRVGRGLYMLYFRWVLPVVGRLVSRHRTAYSYLPDSVLNFPSPPELATMMRNTGFRNVGNLRLTFGIVTLHWGVRS